MSRNPSDQYEYWESLKKSFPKEFMEKARESYEKNREPDLWDSLDDGIRKSLKDDAEITVSGEKTDTGLTETFVMGGSKLHIDISMKSLDEILDLFIEFDFDDDDGEEYESIEMYYTAGDDYSYGSALTGMSHVVDYFRERTRYGKGDTSNSIDKAIHGLRNELDSHSWIDACDSVARDAVTSVRDGYLHERWNSMDVVAENNADDDIFNDSRLFSSDDGKAVVLMTFLDNGPNINVSFDMYATGECQPDDGLSYCIGSMHRVLPFIDNQGFPFTLRVLLTINDFLDSSGIRK